MVKYDREVNFLVDIPSQIGNTALGATILVDANPKRLWLLFVNKDKSGSVNLYDDAKKTTTLGTAARYGSTGLISHKGAIYAEGQTSSSYDVHPRSIIECVEVS